MKANAPSKGSARQQPVDFTHDAERYHKVRGAGNRAIRGLWKRGDRFYARLSVEDPLTGRKQVRRVPLLDKDTKEPVATVAAALKALERLKVKRDDRDLPILHRCPKFADYVERYCAHLDAVPDLKRASTVAKEKGLLRLWVDHLGETRLDRITKPHLISFMEQRQKEGMSARTVNLDIIALRNCLKFAIQEDWIRTLPTVGIRPLRSTPTTRPLFTPEDIDAICAATFKPAFIGGRLAKKGQKGRPLRNAQEFVDYIRFMQFTGARRNETLRVRWADVDFPRGQVTIGADGASKNRQARVVDFNAQLGEHLQFMHKRRQPDSQWLFPSPQRGDRDVPAQTFRQSLALARSFASKTRPQLASFGFHDCRHHFISYCVMAGVDFMTIAKWAGHSDGGVLIGKVYGHLADEHRKQMAERVTFPRRLCRP